MKLYTAYSNTLSLHDALPIYHGISAESTVALADEQLRAEIKEQYPALWERIVARRKYRSEEHTSELQSRGHLVCRFHTGKNKKIDTKSYNKTRSLTHFI